VERSKLSFAGSRGRRLLSAAVTFVLLAGAASAQTVIVEPPRLPPAPGTSGVGGGAGLIPPMPQLPTAPAIAPTLPAPLPAPVPAAPEATPATPPAEPARVVRFRCDVAPEAETCKDPGASDGGGGDDSECSCTRDLCYDQLDPATGHSHRVCEKAQ
jgi:hypothetical protein